MADWSLSVPADNATVASLPGHIRNTRDALATLNNREHVAVAGDVTAVTGGEHKNGSAVAYEGTSTPSNRPDAATALADNAYDRGRLWLDDNYNPPVLKRWDGTAWEVLGRYIIDAASVAMILHNLVEEDSDGGRESRIIVYGEQSGGERSTLGYIEISHDGASDDQKGQMRFVVNDGDDDDAPSKVGMVINSDGTVTFAQVVTLADTSTLATSGAPTADAQIANKKYVDDQITAIQDPAYSGGESHTFDGGLIMKMGYKAGTGAQTITFGTAFPNAIISASLTPYENNDSDRFIVKLKTLSTSALTIYASNSTTGTYWMAIGY